MIVDEVEEILSFKQNKWLEKFINFNTQERNKAENDFGKTSVYYSLRHFIDKQWKMYKIV